MNNKVIIDSNITPTDVKIYVENGTPYLDYTGICYASNGDKIKVHLPKVGLTLNIVTQEKEYEEWKYQCGSREIFTKFNVYASNGQLATFEVLEREVSKKQLEKELGYKLNIKE